MAETPLPHSNFGTASLVERRDGLPPVELEEGPGAEVPVEDTAIIAAPGLNIELEEDGGVVIDFDPRPTLSGTGDFYDNLAETLSDAAWGRFPPSYLSNTKPTKTGARSGRTRIGLA